MKKKIKMQESEKKLKAQFEYKYETSLFLLYYSNKILNGYEIFLGEN